MKTIFRLFLLLILLTIIAVLVFLVTFDINRYRQDIETAASKLLQHQITINRLEMKLSLVPTVRASGVTIKQYGDIHQPPLLQTDKIETTLELLPLLKDQIEIHAIRFGDTTMNIPLPDSDNGAVITGKNPITYESFSPKLRAYLDNTKAAIVTIPKLTANYRYAGQDHSLLAENMTINQLQIVNFTTTLNHRKTDVSANMDLLRLFLHKNDFAFNVTLKMPDTEIKTSGMISDMANLDGILLNLTGHTTKLPDFLPENSVLRTFQQASTTVVLKGKPTRLKIEQLDLNLDKTVNIKTKGTLNDLPTKPSASLNGSLNLLKAVNIGSANIRPMSVKFNMELANDKLTFDKIEIAADRSEMAGDLTIFTTADKYIFRGNFSSGYVELSDLIEMAPASGSVADNSNPLKTFVLTKTEGLIDWTIRNTRLETNSEDYYGMAARTILKEGNLTVNPLKIRTAAGIIDSALVIQNLDSAQPVIHLRVNGENLDISKWKSVAQYLKGSTANVDANIVVSGKTPADWRRTLTGKAEIEITQGKIVNKWFNELPEMVGLAKPTKSVTYSQTDAESTLHCAALGIKASSGVLTMNDSLAIETSNLNLIMSGNINLPAENLAVTMRPELPNAEKRLTQLIRIEGAFAEPQIHLDANAETPSETEVPAAKPIAALCEQALGRKLKGKIIADTYTYPQVTPSQQTPVQPQAQELTVRDELKQQLIKSIRSVVE